MNWNNDACVIQLDSYAPSFDEIEAAIMASINREYWSDVWIMNARGCCVAWMLDPGKWALRHSKLSLSERGHA